MTRFICIAALAASAAFAEDKPAAPPAMPPGLKPAAEMKIEKWFVGAWDCKGLVHESALGPETKVATRVEFKLELAGAWLQVKGTATAGPAKGKEIFEGFAGWDGAQYQRYDFQPVGMTHLSSKGWDGDKLVYEGDGVNQGRKLAVRHTITKKSDDAYDGAIELDGKPLLEESCQRVKAAR